ncbi:endoplasmic reticulum vesicle transporter-domain-containing protein [Mycena galopus ATCC 62051]|nr:endoplasmic reticulum vesicle transporter-domain-containing protein [Mycena galopus ATCC 62051]
MKINVDLVVAMRPMPCSFISVDLRDATIGIRRDGTKFDVGQTTAFKEHTKMLSARQAVAQSRNSRGFFTTLFQWTNVEPYFPRYKHELDAGGCHVSGQVEVKKVTGAEPAHHDARARLFERRERITPALAAASMSIIIMNLSHVITEFSFGSYFPDITQPFDNSLEVTHEPFVAYQCFLHVLALGPAAYQSVQVCLLSLPASFLPLLTILLSLSVTHYTRVLSHHSGTPGIFFKFDLDPMSLMIHQRTSTFLQLIIRCVGVIGGVFVGMRYSLKVTTAAVSALVDNSAEEIPPAVVSASALRTKFSGAFLTKRAPPSSGRLVSQGNGWIMESAPGSPVPYGGASSPYSGTPVSSTFPPPSPFSPPSPYPGSPSGVCVSFPSFPFRSVVFPLFPFLPPSSASTMADAYLLTPSPSPLIILPHSSASTYSFHLAGFPGSQPAGWGPARTPAGSIENAAAMGIQLPGTPQYGIFPPTPGPAQTGFNVPPPPAGNKRLSMNGSPAAEKKKDD